jgi:hypothetical protein
VAPSDAVSKAAELRIYAPGGIRYVVDTQTIDGVTFGVYGLDGVDNPRFDVVDEDGTIERF